jgi:release factor glutamine methyltransferase
VPQDLRDARRTLERRLAEAGVASPAADAVWLIEAATGLSRAEQILEGDRLLSSDEAALLSAWSERRAAREPLQFIVGVAPFCGLELQVRPGVLIPRPETERLVEIVLAGLRDRVAPVIHDVGTGTGAIALALAAARPDAIVTASDVDPTAVLIARANATLLGLEVDVHGGDLLNDPVVARAVRRADALVANPPYLPEGDRAELPPEVAHDPPAALFAGRDGLAIVRRLMRQAWPLLRPGARCYLELDPRNVAPFALELSAAGWSDVAVDDDLAGRPRFLSARR